MVEARSGQLFKECVTNIEGHALTGLLCMEAIAVRFSSLNSYYRVSSGWGEREIKPNQAVVGVCDAEKQYAVLSLTAVHEGRLRQAWHQCIAYLWWTACPLLQPL